MALARRTAAAAPPPQAGGSVNFGSQELYVSGGGIPDGDYLWKEANWENYPYTNKAGVVVNTSLACVVQYIPLDDPRPENIKKQPYSVGQQTEKNFVPSADGKGLEPRIGSGGGTFNNSSNWAELRDSLLNSALPDGLLMNDLSVLDGSLVHILNKKMERGNMPTLSDVPGGVQANAPKMLPLISAFLDNGMPWEGGGGLANYKAATGAAPAVAARAAAKAPVPITRPAAVVPVAEAVTEPDEDVMTIALNAVSDQITAKPEGMPKVVLKVNCFAAIKKSHGADMAQAAQEIFNSDDALTSLLGELAYGIVSGKVQPNA